MLPSRRIGPFTVTALPDGEGPFFSARSEAFPDATDDQWAAADRFTPERSPPTAAGGSGSAPSPSAASGA